MRLLLRLGLVRYSTRRPACVKPFDRSAMVYLRRRSFIGSFVLAAGSSASVADRLAAFPA